MSESFEIKEANAGDLVNANDRNLCVLDENRLRLAVQMLNSKKYVAVFDFKSSEIRLINARDNVTKHKTAMYKFG